MQTVLHLKQNKKEHVDTNSKLKLIIICLLLHTHSLIASEELDVGELLSLSLEELFDVEIAAGFAQTRYEAPGVVTVITARDIEAMGASHLSDVLRTVPGLYLGFADAGQYNSNYIMRGVRNPSSNNILLMINGFPIKNLGINAPSVLQEGLGMPLASVARIEVLRGSGSALYGADAGGGVINIITKTAEDTQGTEVGVKQGSFNTQSAWLVHGQQYDNVGITASVEYTETDGFRPIIEADLQSTFDALMGTHISYTPASANTFWRYVNAYFDVSSEQWRLSLIHQKSRSGTGIGTRSILVPDVNYWDVMSSTVELEYTYDKLQHWQFDFKLGLRLLSLSSPTPGQNYTVGSLGGRFPYGETADFLIRERHPRAELSAFYSGFTDHMLYIGSGYHKKNLYQMEFTLLEGLNPYTGQPVTPDVPIVLTDTPYSTMPTGQRENTWLYLQDSWSFAENWQLTAGLRYDYFSDFESATNPRLSLVWKARDDFTVKLLYGKAFDASPYLALNGQATPFVGNPDLKPVTRQSYELAFAYSASKQLQLAANFFIHKVRDNLVFVSGGNPSFFNRDEITGRGVELEMRWQPNSSHTIDTWYAHQRNTIATSNQDVARAPQHSMYLRHHWTFNQPWSLDTQLYWADAFKRDTNDIRDEIGSQSTVDLTLRYKPQLKGWNLALGVRNLFKRNNLDPSPGPSNGILAFPYDLPMSTRSVFGEIRYAF